MKHKKYVVYLHSCGVSQTELKEIFEKGREDPESFFENLSNEKLGKYISNQNRREEVLKYYQNIDTKKIDGVLEKLRVNIICLGDREYPKSLENISHTPYILYVRGVIPKEDMFGVVGARKITTYGKKCIEKIVPDIAKIFPIVSGGAAGCDTHAHKAALRNIAKTVVVVGTGIDQTYPVSNAKLFDEVVDSGGAIISIFRIGEPGNPYNFPVRNEIVVGISRGILVVEAEQKSGSLITAALCLDYGKDLFAIPGDITHPLSGGTNMLIKKGEAKCVTESLDILEEYNIIVKKQSHKQQIPLLDNLESEIYNLVSQGDTLIDTLIQKLQKSPQEIMMKISLLELKGIIKKDINGMYTLI